MSTTLFRQKAPGIMRSLMSDFGLSVDDAAAILGNIGHECGGFSLMQEVKPLIPGSKGGYGWCQWTGSRRRDFEAYCSRNGLDPASDKANYGFLFVELNGAEGARSLPAVIAARTLRDKTIAFSDNFLRPGIKHHDSRYVWAQRAKAAYLAQPDKTPSAPVKEVITTIGTGGGAAAAANEAGWGWPEVIGIGFAVAVIVGVAILIYKRRQ